MEKEKHIQKTNEKNTKMNERLKMTCKKAKENCTHTHTHTAKREKDTRTQTKKLKVSKIITK